MEGQDLDHRYHVTNFSEMNLKGKRQCQLVRFDVIFVIFCEHCKRFVITCFGGTLLVFGISLKSVFYENVCSNNGFRKAFCSNRI